MKIYGNPPFFVTRKDVFLLGPTPRVITEERQEEYKVVVFKAPCHFYVFHLCATSLEHNFSVEESNNEQKQQLTTTRHVRI